MKKGSWFILLLVFVVIPVMAQQTPDQEMRIQKLERLLEQQQQHIQELQQRLNETEKAPQPQAPAQISRDYVEQVVDEYMAAPQAEEEGAEFGYESGKGFFIRVPNFELNMSGAILMGVAIFENDTPDDNSVFPNGAWLTTDVWLYNDWHARLEVNFHIFATNIFQGPTNAEGTRLWDAFIEYLGGRDEFGNPAYALRVGQTHVPFTIEGQYNPNQGPTIWSTPFIAAWGHGRDPGIMLWGVFSDMVEYKLGVFNGEGATTTNATDDFMLAGSLRIYPFKKSENEDVFLHIGVIRSRDNNRHGSGNIASASLNTPWGRQVYDGIGTTDNTQGWMTGVDAGMKVLMPLGDDDINSIRMEGEFMYITWERDFATGRLPFLEGWGGSFSFQFKHNMTPDVPGAGIYPLFSFSYSDADNKNTNDVGIGANIPGQKIFTYTAGLGYSFNEHIAVEFNWVIVDLDEKDIYNGGGNAAKDDRADGSDDIEHAWFVEFIAQW